MKSRILAVVSVLALVSSPAFAAGKSAAKSCDTVKADIEAKLTAKKVTGYTLEAVATKDAEKGGKVIGSCEGGAKKVVYSRAAKKK